MLPTDKAENAIIKGFSGDLFYSPMKPKNSDTFYHLYIVTDDEIKEGDWYIYKSTFLDGTVKTQEQFDKAEWNVSQCGENGEAGCHRAQFGKNAENGICGCYKIIATTDPELIHKPTHWDKLGRVIFAEHVVAEPSKAFIENYCKIGGIDEVDVEYQANEFVKDGISRPVMDDGVLKDYKGDWKYVPKVDSHNTITIHPIKDSWSRKEVEGLCKEAFSHGVRLWEDWERDDWEMWRKFKKENL